MRQLITRVAALTDPLVDLRSHPETRALLEQPSPLLDRPYKQREDLLDAVTCAWTARLWLQRGVEACQVLGGPEGEQGRWSTLIAPCRPDQRGEV